MILVYIYIYIYVCVEDNEIVRAILIILNLCPAKLFHLSCEKIHTSIISSDKELYNEIIHYISEKKDCNSSQFLSL